MSDCTQLLGGIKKAAVEAVAASKPADGLFGTVLSAGPLEIKVEQKLKLTARQLILTRNVTDYEMEMTMEHRTEPAGSGEGEHVHDYIGKKVFRVHNGLKAGDKVLLLRLQGGQKYLVLDKVDG